MAKEKASGRRNRSVVILPDGRPLKYLLQRRDRDPCWLVRFRAPDGRRVERSTCETAKPKAEITAAAVIRATYDPRAARSTISWVEASASIEQQGRANNLRPATTDSYLDMIRVLRACYPATHGPADVTKRDAERFKSLRLGAGKSPNTVAGNIRKFQIIYRKWGIEPNPWEGIRLPKTDKPAPRVIAPEEQRIFFDWFRERWSEWRLPLLFLEVKASVGCRIGELAELPSSNLQDGRLVFEAIIAKGRKTRKSKPPQKLYEELHEIAGSRFVFERFSDELRNRHLLRGRGDHAASVREFAPHWLEDEVEDFRIAHPEVKKFKLHNFRGTAMSQAKAAGASYDESAIAFGCHPETMRRHYIGLDDVSISDSVFERIGGESVEGTEASRRGSSASCLGTND